MADTEALLLGPLELHVGSVTFRIPGGRQRALLACLLLARARALSAAELVGSVYGADADQRTVHSLHELVSSLRRSLEKVELGGRLRRTAGGYVFDVDSHELDASRFESLLEQAQIERDPEVQSDLLRRALDIWRGRALEGTRRVRSGTDGAAARATAPDSQSGPRPLPSTRAKTASVGDHAR